MIWRGSLFLKYAIPLVVLVMGGLVISGLVEIYFSYQENKSALARIQHEKVAAAAIRIEQFVRELEHDLSWIAQTPWGPRGIPLDQRRLDSLRLLRQVPAITEVSHIDPAGHEQLRVSRLAMDVIGSNADLSSDAKFMEAMARKTYFSAVYFRKESEPYMTIAMAGAGEDAGVVAAEANLKFIWDVVSNLKVGKGGNAYVVDERGRLIAHPDISLVLQKTDLSTLPQVREAATALSRDADPPDEAIVGRDVRGTEVLSAHANITPLNWSVFVELPITEAYASLYASIWRTVILVLVGVVVSIVASLFIVRRMVSPIQALRAGAAHIGAGALDHRIAIQSGDELQALADEFNRMTERLQESYAGLERKVEERTRDLRESLEQQTATSEILRVISRSQTDAQPVFDTIAERARVLCGAAHAGVTTYDGQLIHIVALSNVRPEGAAALLGAFPRPPGRETATGRAILDRTVVTISDVTEYPEYGLAPASQTVTFRSAMAVPMLRDGDPVGAITIMRAEAGSFGTREIELLITFANQAVIAVENVRLFKELEERNKSLTEALEQQTATSEILRVISSSPTDLQGVLNAVAEAAARLCAASDAYIVRVEGDHFNVVAQHGSLPRMDLEESVPITREILTSRAMLDRTVLHISDVTALPENEFAGARAFAARIGHRTLLVAPMLREDIAIGAIGIRRTEVRPFSDKQIELLKTFADQAVIAIENVRLFKELEERNRSLTEALEQQTATSEILRVISQSQRDVQPVFETIAANARKLCEGTNGMVGIVDGSLMRFMAGDSMSPDGLDAMKRMFPRPLSRDTAGGRAILSRVAAYIRDIRKDPDYALQDVAQEVGYRSIVCVPMIREGNALGIITVTGAEPAMFTERQIAMLQTFADQAVIAIENVRLFKELQDRTQELARSVEQLRSLAGVSQAVNSTLDLDQVLSTIVAQAVELSSADGGSVYEFNEATGEFRPRATYGYPEDLVETLLATPLRMGEGATGRAAAERAPVQIPDIRAEGAYSSPLQRATMQSGARAVLAVPLLREERILGSLVVTRKSVGEYPTEVVDLVQTFAAQSTLAIQNARLFREIEQKGRELEIASQHKSQFLANMSHELRTPLNAILGYTELIVDQIYGKVPEKIRDVLERVQKSGRHLLGLINDVLDLSKIEAGQLTLSLSDYSFQDAVQSVVSSLESLAKEKGLRLTVEVAPKLPVGRADERRIVQVLLNLVGNAIKFTDAGEVAVRVSAVGDAFRASVSDTGPGIPENQHQRIFEEFQQVDGSSTRAKGGTGLGLAIAKKIIELHGGRIWVESVVGKGSTFTFSLPVKAERQEEAA